MSNDALQKRIGVDLGGTKTEIILTGSDPLDVLERKRVATHQEEGYDALLEQLAGLINEFQNLCETPPLIGMGIPGSIYPKTGLIRNANTQCLIGKALKKDLETRIHNTITLENDANCFALSEALFGAGKGYGSVAGIIMGTGMGGGLVINQELWGGHQGIAGEWGHASFDINGRLCWCGQKGCQEQYISGSGIQQDYYDRTGKHKNVKTMHEDLLNNTDEVAASVLHDAMKYFGRAMANLIVTFDPDVIVLGGGVSNLPLLYTEGIAHIAEHLFNEELGTTILPNKLGDSSGVYGAAALATSSS